MCKSQATALKYSADSFCSTCLPCWLHSPGLSLPMRSTNTVNKLLTSQSIQCTMQNTGIEATMAEDAELSTLLNPF